MLKGLDKLVKGLLLSIPILVSSQNELKAADLPVPNQYGAIYENDGVAGTNGGAGNMDWNYSIQNTNSGKITSARLTDVYSLSQPTSLSLPASWSMTATDNNSDNLWEIIVSANVSFAYIPINGSKNFSIRTDYDTNLVVNVGSRSGVVMFDGNPGFWYTPNIEQLVGPTGVSVPVNVSALADGSVNPSGTVNVPYNTSTNILATANANCRLSTILTNGAVYWTNSSGNNLITSTNLSYGPVTNAGSLTFTFEPKKYTLTVVSTQDGLSIGNPTPGTTNNIPHGTVIPQSIEITVLNPTNSSIRYRNLGPNIQ